jgi:hypothetical protein
MKYFVFSIFILSWVVSYIEKAPAEIYLALAAVSAVVLYITGYINGFRSSQSKILERVKELLSSVKVD